MNEIEKRIMVDRYVSRYAQHGYDVRSLGWGDLASQQLRFKVLSDVGGLDNANVCDVGCGFGDLGRFLAQRFQSVAYHGLDIVPEFIVEGRRRHPELRLDVLDITRDAPPGPYDYVFASGVMNLKIADNPGFIRMMLGRMFHMARVGVAVNFLSSYVDYSQEKDFHMRPEDAFGLGKELTRHVSLRSDYGLYEFTLFLYREARK